MKLDRHKLIQLRAKRRRSGSKKSWRQIDAASNCGVSLPVYVRAENGQDISDVSAGLIANKYGVELAWLEVAEEKVSA